MVAIGGFAALVPSRRVVRVLAGLAVLAVEIVLVAPHVSRGGSALADLRWGWVLAAVACEVASVATYGRLRRRLLSAGGVRMPLRRMGALAVASSAMSATIPAGAASPRATCTSSSAGWGRARRWPCGRCPRPRW